MVSNVCLGTLKDELEKEHKFLFMTVFDENKSWYFNENIKLFTNPSEVDIHDGDFEESNLMHSKTMLVLT